MSATMTRLPEGMTWVDYGRWAGWALRHAAEIPKVISDLRSVRDSFDAGQNALVVVQHPLLDDLIPIYGDCPLVKPTANAVIANVMDADSFDAHFSAIGDGSFFKLILPYLPWIIELIKALTGANLPPLPTP